MDEGVLLFNNMRPDKSFIEEVFKFDARNLEHTDSSEISKYAITLSQYLIYFKSQVNETKVNIYKKKRFVENSVNQLITKDVLKQYKTKRDATYFIIANTASLNEAQDSIEALEEELILVEGVDKAISELIATFKRELTRRENELYQIRQERKY